MSLAVLANHMASKGRHGDDVLVHMSRDEVAHLQKLAKAHGLTLTINPETGLPEAFSLKSLIKAVAPIALGAFLGPAGMGLMTPFQSALAVGGIGALATGSLEKGLMMGLGAYGGAGLGEGLKGAALEAMPSSTAVVSPEAAAQTAGAGTAGGAPQYAYETIRPDPTMNVVPSQPAVSSEVQNLLGRYPAPAPDPFTFAENLTPYNPSGVPAAAYSPEATAALENETALSKSYLADAEAAAKNRAWTDASLADKAKMAYEGVAKDPMAFAKKNMTPGLAALYAGAALGQEQPKLPQGQRYQGYIRNYGYDPYSGTYTAGAITPTSRYAASGGLMGYNGGGIVALAEGGATDPTKEQLQTITNIYQNTLGRDPDAEGLQYWAGRLAQGESLGDVYGALQGSAKYVLGQNAEQQAPNLGMSVEQATTPYKGYTSADTGTIGDEWVRNVLGREATITDRTQDWYKSLGDLGTTSDVETAYKDFLKTKGISPNKAPTWFEASQLKAPAKTVTQMPTTGYMPGWTYDPNATVGSGLVRPEEPAGETTAWKPGSGTTPTMQDVVNAYTKGGGMTGRLPYVPKSLAEQEALYNRLTGSSKSAYDYLQGRTSQYPASPTLNGPLMVPYGQAAMGLPASTYNTRYIYDPATKSYIINPNYKAPELPVPVEKPMADGGLAELAGYSDQEMASVGRPVEGYASSYGVRRPKQRLGYTPSVFDLYGDPEGMAVGPASVAANSVSVSDAIGSTTADPSNPSAANAVNGMDSQSDAAAAAAAAAAADGSMGTGGMGAPGGDGPGSSGGPGEANGGLIYQYAHGGGIYNLGGYSDGGRLLRGPGDGVSDSIPATIGNKQPARLADGEFVIPARIVSELGNGSTDAGARKLYAMMDRIQARRTKTTGKGKVAVNSRADKLLAA